MIEETPGYLNNRGAMPSKTVKDEIYKIAMAYLSMQIDECVFELHVFLPLRSDTLI